MNQLQAQSSITVTPISCEFNGTTFEEWQGKGKELTTVIKIYNDNVRWWLGDWIIYGENNFKEKYSQALESDMYAIGTLRNCVYVCRNVPSPNRTSDLSFDHHYIVAKLAEDQQAFWLNEAKAKKWSVRELRRAVYGEKNPEEKALPERVEPIPGADFEAWWDYRKMEVSNLEQDHDKCELAWKAAKGQN